MPSRTESRQRAMKLAATVGLLFLTLAVPVRAAAQEIRDQGEIERALTAVKGDPNLATSRKVGMLKWKTSSENENPQVRPGWMTWIAGLFRWLDQTSRLLIWAVAAVLVGLAVVFVGRMLRDRDYGTVNPAVFVAPSHVYDLDIRPESLPSDIGAAARALWDRDERRAALALLYRGMLSRLVHIHHVPIVDASTEGDCLVLSATHLSTEKAGYTSRLVRAWQRAVYGREDVLTATVYDLCDGFATNLDATAPERSPGAAA